MYYWYLYYYVDWVYYVLVGGVDCGFFLYFWLFYVDYYYLYGDIGFFVLGYYF